MRHQNSGRQLNRNSSHRKAMFRNMASSLGINSFMSSPTITTNELRELITRDRMMVTEESRQLKEKSDTTNIR